MNHCKTTKEEKDPYFVGAVVNETYKIIDIINKGSFGRIFRVQNMKNSKEFAMKIESRNDPLKKNPIDLLHKESKILLELNGTPGIPRMYQFFKNLKTHSIMVMTLLGKNMETLLSKTKSNKFSIKTVFQLAEQMVCRLETLHKAGQVHRDIKPENFVMGIGNNCSTVQLIDQGLCKKQKDEFGKHIPIQENVGFVGTARQASISSHLGREQCRKDDLESLGYVLVYLARGTLPWVNIQAATPKEKHNAIGINAINQFQGEKKIFLNIPKFTEGLPEEFQSFFQQIRNMNFYSEPNQGQLKKLFDKGLLRLKIKKDNTFDWTDKNFEEIPSTNSIKEANIQEKPFYAKFLTEEQKDQLKPTPISFGKTISKVTNKSSDHLENAIEEGNEESGTVVVENNEPSSNRTEEEINHTNSIDEQADSLTVWDLMSKMNSKLKRIVTMQSVNADNKAKKKKLKAGGTMR